MLPIYSYCQKPAIDTAVLGKWSAIERVRLTENGNYVLYEVNNSPAGSRTLMVKSTEGKWEKKITGGRILDTSKDEKWAIVRKNTTTQALWLGTDKIIDIGLVNDVKLFQRGGNNCLSGKSNSEDLILFDLDNNKQEVYRHVFWYQFDQDFSKIIVGLFYKSDTDTIWSLDLIDLKGGKKRKLIEGTKLISDIHYSERGRALLYTRRDQVGINTASAYSLHWFDIGRINDKIIYSSRQPVNAVMDENGTSASFMADEGLYAYSRNAPKAELKITDYSDGIEKGYELCKNCDVRFNSNANLIFFSVIKKKRNELEARDNFSKLSIWSYHDEYIGSLQEKVPQLSEEYPYRQAFYNISCNSIGVLPGGRKVRVDQLETSDKYVLIKKNQDDEWSWCPSQRAYVKLFSFDSSSRKLFSQEIVYNNFGGHYELSPDEQHLIYYDPFEENYFCYETATGETRNITKDIPQRLICDHSYLFPDPNFGTQRLPPGVNISVRWSSDGQKMIISDNFDLWSVDPSGKHKPVNITCGYGRANNIQFQITTVYHLNGTNQQNWDKNNEVILTGFNKQTKEEGLYQIALNKQSIPRVLLKGPYCKGFLNDIRASDDLKIWCFELNSVNEAHNRFMTRDWKHFTRLTDIKPQELYNWYSVELVYYKLPGGGDCEGALYKPENLDPKNKYPVIFMYYEDAADGLNGYRAPEWSGAADIDIPYWVSQGYLVFTPDIHARIGHPLQEAVESVESAARELMKRDYVDGKRMGLIGHSYGGFETNYIITHSQLFAAAVEGAGACDYISLYGSILKGGQSKQYDAEMNQIRMGVTLWQQPDWYIESSSIFHADIITTPLLILHNKEDNAVPFEQAVELFTALRRLNKPCWLLQYEGETHTLLNEENQKDFTVRLEQFFDHYLMGMAAPKWMTRNVPVRLKSQPEFLELDQAN